MESTVTLHHVPHVTHNDYVAPSELLKLLDEYASEISVLSLDCFDTLIWRKTATPVDVFYALQNSPKFQALGINALMRVRIEMQARRLRIVREKNNEVTLKEIYQSGFPSLSQDEINALVDEEIAAEKSLCYAFTPVVEMIRAAKARGLKIIIVSNTYLEKNQLTALLSHCLPQDAINAIDDIFCSCEYKTSKNADLFQKVMDKLQVIGKQILHIGDNLKADFSAPKGFNLHAKHFIQYEQSLIELFRMHAACSAIFNPASRRTEPLIHHFRGLLGEATLNKPEEIIGYASVGPIMYAFANFILDEVNRLKAQGKKPKVLFLLRDAHLPYLACEALAGKAIGKRVRISRFASLAASFRTRADIDQYLTESAGTGRFKDIMRQLLLPDEIIEPLNTVASHAEDSIAAFLDLIHQDDIQQIIIKKSALFRKRLYKYLENEIDLKKGDTLLFVDLGYTGTSQLLLEPIFKEEKNIDVFGCYMIQLPIPNWQHSRKGLLDPSWCDDRIVYSLVTYIALFEQICTSHEKSLVDYTEEGLAVFSESGVETHQYHKLEHIQSQVLRFIHDAKKYFQGQHQLTTQMLREAAMVELGRFMFLPTEQEVSYLESFQFDLNLGTQDILRVFNQAAGLASLKKRGLFFSFMERNQKTMRTNYPAELRSAGLELVLTIMTQHRFGLEFGLRDMTLRREKLNIRLGNEKQNITAEAVFTYDGYYSLAVPVGSEQAIHIQLGEKYRWIQIESAEMIPLNAYLNARESLEAIDCWPHFITNEMSLKGCKLYECVSDQSCLTIPAKLVPPDQTAIVRIIFRPVGYKEETIAAP